MEKLRIAFVPMIEFERVKSSSLDEFDKLSLVADMCRINTFSGVKKAGSGHLGSSLSALDIFVYLYFHEMNTLKVGLDNPNRDIFFSSKGHDCPGQYAALTAAGVIPYEKLLMLRRIGGLDGHPDVHLPGIEGNSGSLGMGISKGKGMAIAKRLKGAGGRIFVMTGDGELHEGQIWESLQTTVHQRVNNLIAIVDHNKIQTDKPVKNIIDLGDLERKCSAFGWHVEQCDGNDVRQLKRCMKSLESVVDRPKMVIAHTIKGKGISFMEGPRALEEGKGLYRWHAGAPDDETYEAGHKELVDGLNARLKKLGLGAVALDVVEERERRQSRMKETAEKVVSAYGEALLEIGKRRNDAVVLDADLSADCGLRLFENGFPDRFIECGIAEQDMVSTAGGLALHGFLPIVNSFGVFLSSRANEQIYNNATEKTKIIYVCHYAGLIPAGPGKSHQSLRDISLVGALPNMTIIEPCNAVETKAAIDWCVDKATTNCMMRLVISPSPRTIALPQDYAFQPGVGTTLKDGKDAVLFGYGTVLLHEALTASEILESKGFSLKVVDMPWLNRTDREWIVKTIGACGSIFVLDNHFPYGGLADSLRRTMVSTNELRGKGCFSFAVDDFPACGTPQEALKHHGLDGESLAKRILTGSGRNV